MINTTHIRRKINPRAQQRLQNIHKQLPPIRNIFRNTAMYKKRPATFHCEFEATEGHYEISPIGAQGDSAV
jgi:hypothetical protein